MATAFYRNGVVTVTKGSKVVTGNHTTWTGGATKPLPGDVFVFNNKLYEVEVIVSDTELTLYREFEDDTQVDQEYVIMRNASLNISSRIAAAVAIAINQKQQQLDEFNNFLTNTTDPTVEFTDTLGNKVTVIPIPELEREIAELIDNTANIADLVQEAVDAKDGAVAAESNVTAMRDEVTQMKTDVTHMHDDVNTWQQEVSDIKDDIDAKYLQINSWHTETGELKDDAEAAAVKAEEAAQSVSDLEWKQYCQPQANMLANRLLVNNQFAASGMVHSGKHNLDAINEGLWVDISIPNKVFLGGGLNGTSETAHAVMNIAGALCEITTNWTFEDPSSNPDIANRVDMFGIELKELPVTDKVYPLGDLSVTPIDWETANKKEFVSNPYNNIFLMPDESLIQLCWSARVVTGTRSWDWSNLWPSQGPLQYDDGVVFEGYSDTSNVGVFKHESEEKYFYVCGRVPRLNDAAYNNQNFMGSYKFNDEKFWHETGADSLTLEDAFLNVSSNKDTSGRTDGKRAQFIYPSGQGGIIDYRLPARDMGAPEDGAKVFQKVVNGTYRGEEEVSFTMPLLSTGAGDASAWYYLGSRSYRIRKDLLPRGKEVLYGRTMYRVDLTTKEIVAIRITGSANDSNTHYGVVTDSGVTGNDSYLMLSQPLYLSVSGEFTMVDVIGDPANIHKTPDLANGWMGGWVGVPDGTNQQMTRKCLDSGSIPFVYTTNGGSTWNTVDIAINTVLNAILTAGSVPQVSVASYITFAKQTKASVNKPVFNSMDGVGDVWANSSFYPSRGNLFLESVVGKVATSSAGHPYTSSYQRTSTPMLDDGDGMILYPVAEYSPKHTPLDLVAPNNDSPAVKVLWYQAADNRQVSLNFAWNEMVWSQRGLTNFNSDISTAFSIGERYYCNAGRHEGHLFSGVGSGSSTTVDYAVSGVRFINPNNFADHPYIKPYEAQDDWGDDSTIRIIDGTGTFINLNGDTCLYGSAELAIPYGYTKNQARAGSQVPGVDL